MAPTSDFNYREYYTDHIVPLLVASASFLGNCDHPKDFYCSLQREGQLANHSYVSANTHQEMTFLVFGEVAAFHRGTKLNAQGNHYSGKVGEPPIPIKDKSTAKDILKLIEPSFATDDLKALFGNQVVPLNEVVLADKARDCKNNNFPILTQECADSLGIHNDEHIITVQLPKKFGASASAYNAGTAHRTTKKKLLSSDPKHDLGALPADDSLKELVGETTSAPETDEVEVGGYYDPARLPDFRASLFDLDKDQLVQHNIVDEDEKLVPCWTLYDRLWPGTIVLCKVSLHAWNIGNRDGKFKRFYTLNAGTVRILKDAKFPAERPSAGPSNSVPSSSKVSQPAKAAQDDFNMFSAKKRKGKRGVGHTTPVAAEPKTKGKRKATDMDTSK